MALAAGLDLDAVADALTDAAPASRWRMELHERADGLVVINDAYNANPESMRAPRWTSLRASATAAVGVRSRCWARCSSSATGTRGRTPAGRRAYAAEAGVDVLLTVGDAAAPIARGPRAAESRGG